MNKRFKDFLAMDAEQIKKEAGKVRKAHSPLVRAATAHKDKTKFDKAKDRKGAKQNIRRGMYEAQTLTNVRLTDHQKSVLANIVSRNNENTTIIDLVANVEEVHKQNLATAVKTLEKIGLIQLTGKELTVTDSGMNVMKDEGMVDDMGGLTPDGQEYQFKYVAGEEGKTQDDVNQEMGGAPVGGIPNDMGEPPADLGMPEQPMMAGAKFSLKDAMEFIAEYKL
jgi:hypothetical protein